ncbi:MAG: RluA family pseudouridine synthase [Flavobacteriaceae bacterium]|nr:RluA family pseudouridine synthase [Flavobacteriaceae bacterium]
MIDLHIVPDGDYQIRIQEYAATVIALLPTRSAVKKALKKQELYVNGKVATSALWIQSGQEISYIKKETPIPKVFPLSLDVLFEDEYLAAVFKPSGYPTSGNYYKTIEHALPHNLKPSNQKDALAYPRPVHRLDAPTSGLLLIAKTQTVQRELHLAFEKKSITKQYHAVIAGKLNPKGRIESPIKNKIAITEYETIKTIFAIQNVFLSLLKLSPITGRTHQLRIHLAEQETPIVGDKLYGNDQIMMHKGLFLCATRLKFKHPITQQEIQVEGTLPNKFNTYLLREENRFKKYNHTC